MSDSHLRVMKSVEKCLMEELRKGVDGLEGKTEFVVECPSITVVATLEFIAKPTDIPVLNDNRVDNREFVGGPVSIEDQLECQKQTENLQQTLIDPDHANSHVELVPSKTVCLLRLSRSVTKAILVKMIADEIQPDGFAVALQAGPYANAKRAYVKFESVEAAIEAKLKLDQLIAKHTERGDKSVFTAVSFTNFLDSTEVYVGILSDDTTVSRLRVEGEKLDGFETCTLLTFCDNFRYGLLNFQTNQQANAAIDRLNILKAQYRDEGADTIFLESTVFRFGIPKVPNPQEFLHVHADSLKSGVTQDQLLTVVMNKLRIYGCLGANLMSDASAIFGFDSAEGASWGFYALIILQKLSPNHEDSIFTLESQLSWPQS